MSEKSKNMMSIVTAKFNELKTTQEDYDFISWMENCDTIIDDSINMIVSAVDPEPMPKCNLSGAIRDALFPYREKCVRIMLSRIKEMMKENEYHCFLNEILMSDNCDDYTVALEIYNDIKASADDEVLEEDEYSLDNTVNKAKNKYQSLVDDAKEDFNKRASLKDEEKKLAEEKEKAKQNEKSQSEDFCPKPTVKRIKRVV
jgi:hypothetical protein